ncbi:uncharacterized protein P884DRAFT_280640 [Thermothelomyces heterothallicus CBS 202.75]|uniref:uncharacterized protein n=1 Tax=Thermothelomyces heterothallicus CBS 202.75 TaxID=1149848 RepID=UPI003743721F
MPDAEGNRTITNHAVRNGREFISYSDCTSYTRKLDRLTNPPLTDWTPVETAIDDNLKASVPETSLHLSVVAEPQAENEPKHWCLFSHIPNEMSTGPCHLTGDAELMHFEHATGVDKLSSPDFALHQVLNKDLSAAQLATVDAIAREEKPPRAPNRAALRKLVELLR